MADTIREKVLLDGEETVSDAFRKAGGGVDSFDKKLRTLVTAGGLFLAAGAIAKMGGAVLKLAIDAGEAGAAFDTTFGPAVGRMNEFVDEFANKAGFATGELEQMLAVTGNVVQGIGATEEQSAALSEQMAILAGDVASFSNAQGGAAMVLAALQSAINGEREALKSYGLAISEVEVQERALQMTQKERASDLTRLEKAEATVAVAYDKAGKAIGDLDRTQDSAANTLRRLQAELKEAGTAAGEELLPHIERLLPLLEDLIPVAGDAGGALVDAFGSAAPAIAHALSGIDELIFGIETAANSAVNVGAGLVGVAVRLGSLGLIRFRVAEDIAESAAQSNRLAQAVYETRNAMREGKSGTDAYSDALLFLVNQGSLTKDAILELADVTDLGARGQSIGIQNLLDYAEAHNWTAENIAILREAQGAATIEAAAAAGAYRDAGRHGREMGDEAAAAAGQVDLLSEAEEEAADKARDLRDAALEAAKSFRDDLAAGAREFLTGFEAMPERIKISLGKWEQNFTDRLETQRSFWSNLKILAEAGLTDLAEEIRAEGPTAAGFLDDLVADMGRAIELDTLAGDAKTEMGKITGAYAEALQLDSAALYGDLEVFGGTLIESIIAGAYNIDLGSALSRIVAMSVDQLVGNAPRTGNQPVRPINGPYDSGTWAVPGGPGDASMAEVHGTEIIIPPYGSSGRADFARQLAAALRDSDGGGQRVNIDNLNVAVTVPAGTSLTEAVSAAAVEAAIEAALS